MAPEKNDEELAEWLADFFNGISSEYDPFDKANLPESFDRNLPLLSQEEVVKKIRSAKITASVPGDLPAAIYEDLTELVAEPVTHIFNCITSSAEWPKDWASEQVTIIPKGRFSEQPSECRNISCTNFLSKIYESFVLS